MFTHIIDFRLRYKVDTNFQSMKDRGNKHVRIVKSPEIQ